MKITILPLLIALTALSSSLAHASVAVTCVSKGRTTAQTTDGMESGMWGSLLVDGALGGAFEAKNIFKAGDHMGGTVHFSCTTDQRQRLDLAPAGESYACTPEKSNSYFTDPASLVVLNSSTIEVNQVKLQRDEAFKPRTMKDFERYTGDTARASAWTDSGLVEIFLNAKTKRLLIRVRGETFISESFSCK